MDNKRVLVAMSGGVDSTAACLLLKEKGYDCIGATIKTWPKEECENTGKRMCCSFDSITSARHAAFKLDIPHYVFDMSADFKKNVRDYFNDEYERGRTPNPCVYCNSHIKFGELAKKADELECAYIATGHYVRVIKSREVDAYFLKKGMDKFKDQSYFLFNLKSGILKRLIFPLGVLSKKEVRQIAKKAGLKQHDRKSSQDVCFDLPSRKNKKGKVLFKDGSLFGYHHGIAKYTIGQRKGLGIAYKEPLYVIKIDVVTNTVHLGVKKDTFHRIFTVENMNWFKKPIFPIKLNVKIRYQSEDVRAQLRKIKNNLLEVELDKAKFSPAPGQAAVFYERDVVIGGGWIKEIIE